MNEESGIIIWLDSEPALGTIRTQEDIVRFYSGWKDCIREKLASEPVEITDLEATSGLIVIGPQEALDRISQMSFPDKTRIEQLDDVFGG